ncbi:MAG: hypothetical protein ABR586_09185, partial [Thermoplasmatota archaeon]
TAPFAVPPTATGARDVRLTLTVVSNATHEIDANVSFMAPGQQPERVLWRLAPHAERRFEWAMGLPGNYTVAVFGRLLVVGFAGNQNYSASSAYTFDSSRCLDDSGFSLTETFTEPRFPDAGVVPSAFNGLDRHGEYRLCETLDDRHS